MEGFYLVSWATLEGLELGYDYIYALIDDENIKENDDGLLFKQSVYPDVVPEPSGNGIPDFLETGPGSGTTTSQGWIGG